jgi:ATP-binding cassette, sub-family E, member 1
MEKTLGSFKLKVKAGTLSFPETIVMLGQNGTGKTTFFKMLAGIIKPDDPTTELKALNFSFKPQKL